MEYISYADVRTRLDDLLIKEHIEGAELRLSLELPDDEQTRVVFGTPSDPDEDATKTRKVKRAKDELIGTVDGVLHRLHITEFGILPVGEWRGVMDLAAFDLATDEDWNDFEAEASMHMNSRDVLMFSPSEFSIAMKIIQAVMEHADAPTHDLTLMSLVTPFVLEMRQSGGMTVFCPNETIADEVAQVTGSHDE